MSKSSTEQLNLCRSENYTQSEKAVAYDEKNSYKKTLEKIASVLVDLVIEEQRQKLLSLRDEKDIL